MRPRHKKHLMLAVLIAMAMSASACASNHEAMQKQHDELEKRLRGLERTQGRTMVKLEDLENQLELVLDKVETNRLALERRGDTRSLPVIVERPDYNSPAYNSAPAPVVPAAPRRLSQGQSAIKSDARVRAHIPVPGTGDPYYGAAEQPQYQYEEPAPEPTGNEEHVVYSDERFRAEFGEPAMADAAPAAAPAPAPRRRKPRSREPVVTGERLPTNTAPIEEKLSANRSAIDVYKNAIALYRQGDYSGAYGEFERYLSMGPPRDYLDNAYYWLGECSYGQGQFQQAISFFDRVLKEVPEGNKVPDAMLKAALAYSKLGKADKARSLLDALINTYPTTNAAKIASRRLQNM